MFDFFKLSVSPQTFAGKIMDWYLHNSFKLEEGFIRGLAGTYSDEQCKMIRGQISALIAFAHEAAVRQYVKPQYQGAVLRQINSRLINDDVRGYRESTDIGMTFMEQCGFERNAYLYQVGGVVFETVKGLVKKVVQQVRIEEGGM